MSGWVATTAVVLLFMACATVVISLFVGGRAADRGEDEGFERPEYGDAREEATAQMLREAAADLYLAQVSERERFRLPPYVGGRPDPEHTEPLRRWEEPRPPTTYVSTNGYDD